MQSISTAPLMKKLVGVPLRKYAGKASPVAPTNAPAAAGPVVTMNAIQVTECGPASILKVEQIPIPKAQPGQVLIRNRFAGLNFIDTYHRTGLYARDKPFVLGVEGGGEIIDAGTAKDFRAGDRVVYYAPGSYAEYTAVEASAVLPVPKGMELDVATALMVQGMTAHYLARSTFPLNAGDWCVVRAAAGGTGQLLCQIAKALGAKVIATVSSLDKANIAHQLGACHVTTHDKVVECVRDSTKGQGAKVVYDGIGKATWQQSLECLGPRGMLVLYGNASGPVPAIDPLVLAGKGSLFVTRPRLNDYLRNRVETEWRARELSQWVMKDRKLKVKIDKTFKLADAQKAHEYIEAGKTVGKVLLGIPSK